jgi:SEC-C motif domain protein
LLHPETAEALMRSRFSAYALRNAGYLLASWDSNTRPASIDFSKETAIWQQLQVISIRKGNIQDQTGTVEFKAYFNQDGVDCFMHEISRFVKIKQRWLYLDGVIKSVGKVSKTEDQGKNAPCACGSGKKFKRCCGR